MKTARQPISNASFITPILRSFFNNLQRKKSVKRLTLVFFVMVCILIRYVVLSGDKNLIPHQKPAAIIEFSIWPSTILFKQNPTQSPKNNQFKSGEVDFKESKTDQNSSNANSKRL